MPHMGIERQILIERCTKVPYIGKETSGVETRLMPLSKATLVENMYIGCFGDNFSCI